MLSNIESNNKSYEQIREEAVAQIPIYSRDWTNYNVSDPGITILENFSAFAALQQSEIDEIPDKVKIKLLKLAGFTPQKGRTAHAYISLASDNSCLPDKIPDRLKLYAQNICFEFENDTRIKNMRITDVKTRNNQERSLNNLTDRHGVKGGVYLLGAKPSFGEEIYLLLNDIPDAGGEAAIYFEMDERFSRNRFADNSDNPFAKTRWEIKSQEGYLEFKVNDGTNCFLQSGYVRFVFSDDIYESIAKSENENAYVIRITLEKADYDIVPRFKRICGLLMRVVQKDTRSDITIIDCIQKNDITVNNFILNNGFLELYGEGNDGLYHRYLDVNALNPDDGTRYYHLEQKEGLEQKIVFECDAPKKIMAVCRDESVMAYRSLGILYGYDEQVISLPQFNQVCTNDFSIIVVQKNGICHIVEPNDETKGEVRYSVRAADNTIVIHDCGLYEGAEIRLGKYSLYMGSDGNVLHSTEFELEYDNNKIKFVSCSTGDIGYYEEELEHLRKRFAADIKNAAAMVTQKDCEQIISRVPGLSIHKIGVCSVPRNNEIYITVKPNSDEKFPKLSDIYIQEINKYVENYRMLTTKVIVEQPVYVPINVKGLIYIKKHFKRCKSRVQEMLKKMLDGINSDACFGDKIVFYELHRKLEDVDGIDEICELSIFPSDYRYADMSGLDIRLAPNALYYTGELMLEFANR